MSAIREYHQTTCQPFNLHLTARLPETEWFDSPASFKDPGDTRCPATSTTFNGLLGVLRQEGPALERQRRYDFWDKPS